MILRDICRRLKGALMLMAVACVPFGAMAFDISNAYRSPRNPERKIRKSTELIILHTTEAPARSSLNKVSDRGECHYCVTEVGRIYRIVDRDREAFHAGRSMWNGKEDVDCFSIGIECVGYHNKPMSIAQINAICELVKKLQAMYNIPDHKVIAHSHVAYGAPNRYHKRRHRGRKRCGMLFAMPSVRRRLMLKTKPAYDPDTRAGRLVVADDYLCRVLYGNIDTMAGTYGGGKSATKASTAKPQLQASVPAKAPAKPAAKAPAKTVVSAGPAPKSIAELKARGYRQCGTISKENTALKIAGARWNAADTYYTIRNKVIPGSTLDAARIEKGMSVWLKK